MERSFQIDWTALWVFFVLAGVVFFFLRRKSKKLQTQTKPHLLFSHIADLASPSVSWRVRLVRTPLYLMLLSFCAFGMAFIDPHILVEKDGDKGPQRDDVREEEPKIDEVEIPTEGIAIYLILDRSSSMEQEINVVSSRGKRQRMSRFDYLKQVTGQFIRGNEAEGILGRSTDMIGLVEFARVAHIVVPLTLDHDAILDKLARLQSAQRAEEDGTAMGYAVFKTVNMVTATKYFAEELVKEGRPSYEVISTAIILVTDGFPTTNPLDKGHQLRNIKLEQAATYAAEQDIHLYIVNIEPAIQRPRYRREREELMRAAEKTGGQFFVADDSMTLQRIYAKIDELEKTELPQKMKLRAEIEEKIKTKGAPEQYRKDSYYPLFVGLGLLTLFGSILLSTTWLRRAP